MNLLSLIVAGLLTVLTLAFATMLVSAIIFNLQAGKKYRRSLAKRIDQLRLSNMLSALGIDVNSYLHTQGIGHVKVADIDFCNNEKSLQEIAQNKA
jgi:hypothetical protein